MSDLNDLELANLVSQIHRWNAHLDRQMADGLEGALFLSLLELEDAAQKAQARLNKIRWVPFREPMGS